MVVLYRFYQNLVSRFENIFKNKSFPPPPPPPHLVVESAAKACLCYLGLFGYIFYDLSDTKNGILIIDRVISIFA